jgi:hypothetical protein
MTRCSRCAALLLFLVLGVCLLPPADLTAPAPNPRATKKETEDAAALKEFSARIQEYVQVNKSVESSLPPLKTTDLPEMIAAHQQALARKIREARSKARRGDIFTPKVKEAFRHLIRSEFRGPHASHASATIKQGDPLRNVRLTVNQVYPDNLPFTTVPPTLLLKFPKLPEEVAYRIVGRDLVLLDVKANLVVDLYPKDLPYTL